MHPLLYREAWRYLVWLKRSCLAQLKTIKIISKYEELIEELHQEKDGRPVIGSILICNQPCLVEVFMSSTIKNKEIISKYEELIEALDQEIDVRPVIGSILLCNQPHEPAKSQREKRRRSHVTINPSTKAQKITMEKTLEISLKSHLLSMNL